MFLRYSFEVYHCVFPLHMCYTQPIILLYKECYLVIREFSASVMRQLLAFRAFQHLFFPKAHPSSAHSDDNARLFKLLVIFHNLLFTTLLTSFSLGSLTTKSFVDILSFDNMATSSSESSVSLVNDLALSDG